MTYTVSVAGASGYAGGELLRLVLDHPELRLGALAAGGKAGQPVSATHPQLVGLADRDFVTTDADSLADADLVLLALPHGESAALVRALPSELPVVDLGADFRLQDADAWQHYYGSTTHAGTWVYGLPELPGQRDRLADATRVANPGCYATAVALALAPLLAADLVEPQDIVVVAASGTSGAGRKPSDGLLASEVMGSMSPYKVGGAHQHTPEMEQALSLAAGAPVSMLFTPTLAPMSRGILATCTARTAPGVSADVLRDALHARLRRRAVRPCAGAGSAAAHGCDLRLQQRAPAGRPRPPLGADHGARCRGQPGEGRGWTGVAERQPHPRASRDPRPSRERSRSMSSAAPEPTVTGGVPESGLTVATGPGCGGVTAPAGFVAAGVAAGLKASGGRDVALVVNVGPRSEAAGVFTANRFRAAPVLWTAQCLKSGSVRAVILNSGGANACTGPDGFADTHRTAEHVADRLKVPPIEVAVCSTGLIGDRLPMDKLLAGADSAAQSLSSGAGADAAEAIMTTDSVPKLVRVTHPDGWSVGGMAKGAGMLAPGLATMLVVLTTDAGVDVHELDAVLRSAVHTTFDRIDSDGCMSTNDTVLLLASGAHGGTPVLAELAGAVHAACASLARQLIADAEGATKDIRIDVVNAATETDAVGAARAVSRSNLFKCAMHGEDPNWGRILSAVGTTDATFEPDQVAVAINGVTVCRDGAGFGDRSEVDLSGREIVVEVDLAAGDHAASVWTNDLTAMYVHENSAYST